MLFNTCVGQSLRHDLHKSALALAMIGSVVGTAVAQGPVPGASTVSNAKDAADSAPTLFFSQNRACLVPPNCQIPASPYFPNPNDYTTLASLKLPKGDYLVTSKLSAFAADGTSYVNFECALLDMSSNTPLDYSSFDGVAEQTLFLQTPVSFHARSGGDVRIGCRAFGFKPYGGLVDMHVWNVNIAAIMVDRVRIKHQ